MIFRNVTSRLTLWYAGLLFILLLLTGFSAYLILRSALLTEAFSRVQSQAQEAQSLVQENTFIGPDGLHQLELGIPGLLFNNTGGILIQVADSTGRKVLDSNGIPSGTKLPLPNVPSLPGQEIITLRTSNGNTPMALVSYPLLANGRFLGSVQAAGPLDQEFSVLSQVRDILLGVDLLGLLLSLLVGYLIARAAMRPIDRITKAAGRIGIDQLGERLPVQGPADELYRLSTTFNHMLERIQAAVSAQRDFIAAASHELRTPLAIIQGYVGILSSWGKDDEAVWEDSMATLQGELGRMRRMVNDLVVLSRDPSAQAFRQVPVDLAQLVDEVHQDGRVLSEVVELVKGEVTPETVIGDPEVLKQSLLALVDNALKYTPPGGVVTISLACEADWAVLSVVDTGPGIDSDDLPHIFERFYRADKARSREIEGFGLGLSIVKMFVEQHGGQVEVASQKGVGSTFRLLLPRRQGGS